MYALVQLVKPVLAIAATAAVINSARCFERSPAEIRRGLIAKRERNKEVTSHLALSELDSYVGHHRSCSGWLCSRRDHN